MKNSSTRNEEILIGRSGYLSSSVVQRVPKYFSFLHTVYTHQRLVSNNFPSFEGTNRGFFISTMVDSILRSSVAISGQAARNHSNSALRANHHHLVDVVSCYGTLVDLCTMSTCRVCEVKDRTRKERRKKKGENVGQRTLNLNNMWASKSCRLRLRYLSCNDKCLHPVSSGLPMRRATRLPQDLCSLQLNAGCRRG